MRARSVFTIICICAFHFSCGPEKRRVSEPASQPASQVVAEFKIEHWAEPLLVPVVRDGKTGYFAIDTGSSVTVLNSTDFSNLRPLDAQADVDTSGGNRTVKVFYPPDLQVGPFAIADCGPVVCADLSGARAALGRPVIGFLGVSALKGSVLQIDFDNRQVRILRPDHLFHQDWGTASMMQPDEGYVPSIHAGIAGAEQDLQIDTGSEACISLPSEAFVRLAGVAKQATIAVPGMTGNGEVALRHMRIATADVNGATYRDLIYSETQMPHGSLGLDFVERHLVTLDFPNNRFYLKPGREMNHRSEENMSGCHILRSDDQLITGVVDIGSPAYQAGIREGDILIEINGKTAADYDMAEVRDLMRCGDGKELSVTFSDAGVRKTVKLRLRRSI